MKDDTLIIKARKGDKDALVKLIMSYKDDYYRLAYVYMRNKEDALDALQDMIVKLFENIHNLKRNDAFHSWAKTILVNLCKRNLKKAKKDALLDEIDFITADHSVYEPSAIDIQNTSIDLKHGLIRINKNQREAIILKFFLDLDYKTIGKITKTPIGTVKSRVFNGIKNLRAILGE